MAEHVTDMVKRILAEEATRFSLEDVPLTLRFRERIERWHRERGFLAMQFKRLEDEVAGLADAGDKARAELKQLREELASFEEGAQIEAYAGDEARAELKQLRSKHDAVLRFMDGIRDTARDRNPGGATILDFMAVWNEQHEDKIERLQALLKGCKLGSCWCPMGIDRLGFRTHTKHCLTVQKELGQKAP